jgi:hypothetical protein
MVSTVHTFNAFFICTTICTAKRGRSAPFWIFIVLLLTYFLHVAIKITSRV